jgi:DNA recombination protein RmuC
MDDMQLLYVALGAGGGIVLAAVITWLIMRKPGAAAELADLRLRLETELTLRSAAEAKLPEIPKLENLLVQRDRAIAIFQDERKEQGERIAQLEEALTNEQKNAAEKLALLDDAQKKLKDAFDSLASKALNTNNEQFLRLAQQTFNTVQESARGDLEKRQQAIDALVKPLKESLTSVDSKIGELEKARVGAYSTLTQQVTSLMDANAGLRTEAANLAKALSSPGVRGRWGEIQLRRVLELAGMVEYCDFDEQKSASVDGKMGRPDVIVNLPNKWRVAVDSKVPYDAFLEAMQSSDETVRAAKLKEHARSVRGFIDKLSSKSYSEAIQPSPDYVVMFLPGESFYYAAVEQDPRLLEYGAEQRVLVVSPMALIGLLRSIAFGWREEKLAENAREISELGKELYARLNTFVEHFVGIGSGLENAVKAYDKAGRSLKSRVLVTTQKFKDLGATTADDIIPPKEIEYPSLISNIEDVTPLPEISTDNGTQ